MASEQKGARALHWVFKIADRNSTIHFYRDVLGMKALRHEEFDEGCAATCNGPYDNKWSKTMIGYGSEDTEFVFELTYNYGVISGYKLGNDFIKAELLLTKEQLEKVRSSDYKIDSDKDGIIKMKAPDGYPFELRENEDDENKNVIRRIALGSSDLKASIEYWSELLGMKVLEETDALARLSFEDVSGFELELHKSEKPIDHATAPGRVAFSYPEDLQEPLEEKMKESDKGTIINSLIRLDTPGKATVQVVILGDVDGHEICFVGDRGYRELSQFDPKADELLNEAIENDGSKEYVRKKLKKDDSRESI